MKVTHQPGGVQCAFRILIWYCAETIGKISVHREKMSEYLKDMIFIKVFNLEAKQVFEP